MPDAIAAPSTAVRKMMLRWRNVLTLKNLLLLMLFFLLLLLSLLRQLDDYSFLRASKRSAGQSTFGQHSFISVSYSL